MIISVIVPQSMLLQICMQFGFDNRHHKYHTQWKTVGMAQNEEVAKILVFSFTISEMAEVEICLQLEFVKSL